MKYNVVSLVVITFVLYILSCSSYETQNIEFKAFMRTKDSIDTLSYDTSKYPLLLEYNNGNFKFYDFVMLMYNKKFYSKPLLINGKQINLEIGDKDFLAKFKNMRDIGAYTINDSIPINISFVININGVVLTSASSAINPDTGSSDIVCKQISFYPSSDFNKIGINDLPEGSIVYIKKEGNERQYYLWEFKNNEYKLRLSEKLDYTDPDIFKYPGVRDLY